MADLLLRHRSGRSHERHLPDRHARQIMLSPGMTYTAAQRMCPQKDSYCPAERVLFLRAACGQIVQPEFSPSIAIVLLLGTAMNDIGRSDASDDHRGFSGGVARRRDRFLHARRFHPYPVVPGRIGCIAHIHPESEDEFSLAFCRLTSTTTASSGALQARARRSDPESRVRVLGKIR